MHPLALLLLQIAVVLTVARLVGIAFRRIGQPQVVGEMVAGILLGPSLLGAVAPAVYAGLFPPESLPSLNVLSQVGLVLFMFLIGLEFDPAMLRGNGRTAVVTSYSSIVVPFALGLALSAYLYTHLAGPGHTGADGVTRPVGFWPFALFIGSAMSVTAFPVLARILTERNLLSTRLGALTIACAAVDDVTAWSLLALVTAVATASSTSGLVVTLGGTVVYALAMVFALRPALGRLEKAYATRGRLSNDVLGLVLVLLLLSAFATEELGVHALFGAFVLGAVMPKEHGFVHALTMRLESLTVVLLLPLFFAFTGLKTSVGLLNSPLLWAEAALILAVAVAGKFIGGAFASRWTGLSWREASALGILMNTRGLMELVFLTVGLELGVISPPLFAMMVLMALTTTFMTTPALDRIMPASVIRQQRADGSEGAVDRFTVLMPVALPSSGPDLLAAAQALAPPEDAQYVTLHLRPVSDDTLTLPADPHAPDPLAPTVQAAKARGLSVKTLAFASRDIAQDIVDTAEARTADLLLMGWHQPVLSDSILGGTVADVLRRAPMDVAVLVNRTAGPWRRALVPFAGGNHDRAALAIAQRLARQGVELTLLHVVAPGSGRGGIQEGGETFGDVRLQLVEAADPQAALVDEARDGGYDVVVVGADEAWGLKRPTLFGRRHEGLFRRTSASLLIVRGGTAPASAA